MLHQDESHPSPQVSITGGSKNSRYFHVAITEHKLTWNTISLSFFFETSFDK